MALMAADSLACGALAGSRRKAPEHRVLSTALRWSGRLGAGAGAMVRDLSTKPTARSLDEVGLADGWCKTLGPRASDELAQREAVRHVRISRRWRCGDDVEPGGRSALHLPAARER